MTGERSYLSAPDSARRGCGLCVHECPRGGIEMELEEV